MLAWLEFGETVLLEVLRDLALDLLFDRRDVADAPGDRFDGGENSTILSEG